MTLAYLLAVVLLLAAVFPVAVTLVAVHLHALWHCPERTEDNE